MYRLITGVLFRLRHMLTSICDLFNRFVKYRMSRNEAQILRKRLIKIKGNKVVDRALKTELKRYSHETFGSSAYWPWLALYTEMRGEFMEG